MNTIRVFCLVQIYFVVIGLFGAEPQIPRVLPPPGIVLPVAERDKLAAELKKLQTDFSGYRSKQLTKAFTSQESADVEIYLKAVRYALEIGEFYSPKDAAKARTQLQTARERLTQLALGKTPWATQTGLVVRGYRSHIDGSPQPYGLEIPADYDSKKPARLIVWLHGRGDKATDLHFIEERSKKAGEFQAPNTIILHPFGRQCVAFKFAGEWDVFEAIASVRSRYSIDGRPILLGFSMGGAGCWHLAAHHPFVWGAASPGAGFVDVRRYQNLSGDKLPPWYEQRLWNWYDVPPVTENLFQLPLLSYSGELDKQKASADIMESEFAARDKKLLRVIGRGMGHKYDASSIKEILSWVDKNYQTHPLADGELQLLVYELSYGRSWLAQLERQQPPREIAPSTEPIAIWQQQQFGPPSHVALKRDPQGKQLSVTTRNVRALELLPTALPRNASQLLLDGQSMAISPGETWYFEKPRDRWIAAGAAARFTTERKTAALSGPIDQAFLRRFVFVAPTGISKHPEIDAWVRAEMDFQIRRWRELFRGDVQVLNDDKLDFAQYRDLDANLILWGDRDSNRVIRELVERFPLAWNDRAIVAGDQSFDTATHILTGIYPLQRLSGGTRGNGQQAVVFNSGPTFRPAHDKTNSQQTPKLPDWAVLNIQTPRSDSAAGKIVAAGFFDAEWRWVDPQLQQRELIPIEAAK